MNTKTNDGKPVRILSKVRFDEIVPRIMQERKDLLKRLAESDRITPRKRVLRPSANKGGK